VIFLHNNGTMTCKRSMDCTCPQCAAASAEFSVEDLKQFSSSIKYDDEAGDEQEGNGNSNATEAPPKPKPKPKPKPAPKPKPTAALAAPPPITEAGESSTQHLPGFAAGVDVAYAARNRRGVRVDR